MTPMTVGMAGISERLRSFLTEMPYERIPIFNFLQTAAARLPAGADVADVGAGEAPYRELFEHVNYTTIDWENSLHETAAASDIMASADDIPVGDSSLDAVVLTQVLEHVPEPQRVLRELHRITKPNGWLFMTTPLVWELHELPYDFYRYTEFALHHLLDAAGYADIEIAAKNDCFTTLAQLSENLSWLLGNAGSGNPGLDAATQTLRRHADELVQYSALDSQGLLPLGYTVSARRA